MLKPLLRILAGFLPRAPRLCTILQDLAKNVAENAKFVRPKICSQKNLSGRTKKYQESCKKSKKVQETPRILPRNPGKSKNRREKARWNASQVFRFPVFSKISCFKKQEALPFDSTRLLAYCCFLEFLIFLIRFIIIFHVSGDSRVFQLRQMWILMPILGLMIAVANVQDFDGKILAPS